MSASRQELALLRTEIEQLDRLLVAQLARRMQLAREAGRQKRELGEPTLDPAREAEVVRRAVEVARENGLPEEEVREIFWHIIGLSRRAQAQP